MSLVDLPGTRRSLVDGAVFTAGVVALVLAAAVVFAGPLAEPLVTALSPVLGEGFVAVGAFLAAVLAVFSAYERSTAETPARTVGVPRPPSRRQSGDADIAGGRIDRLLEEIHADTLDDDVSRVDASVNRKRVRDRVRRIAIEVLQETEDVSADTAGEMLDDGTWTDRPRARLFLGTDVPRLPLSVRLRDWASGEGFRRRAGAAIEEIAAVADTDVGESIAPPPVGVDEASLDRSPVDWPPEPDPVDDSEELDRLLEQPIEEITPQEPAPDPSPDPDPDPSPETDATEVFRREVIPGDMADAPGAGPSADAAADDEAADSAADAAPAEWGDVPATGETAVEVETETETDGAGTDTGGDRA